MTVLGIGLDIVHLPRFAALIQRRTAARVAARVLSTREHTDFARLSLGERDPAVARFLAVRCVCCIVPVFIEYPDYL
jgi:holo-[acyl-carrier protein] synthase